MQNQNFKTSELFRKFVENLNLSDREDESLRDARKELRREIRGNFRDNFEDFLQKEYNNYRQADIETARQFGEEKVKFLTQGSYAYKTLNKPQQTPPQEIDLDDGAYFRMSDINDRGNLNPNLLFSYVEKRVSLLASRHGWEMKSKPTCIRLGIGKNRHIDLPLYIVPDEQFTEIQTAEAQARWHENFGISYFPSVDHENIWMAHREEMWVKSDPRKIIDWVKHCKEEYGVQFRTLCRIMKAWRDYQWKDSPLSSICIMRMVDMGLNGYSKDSNRELDSLLYDVICHMYQIASQNKAITNPADASKRLDDKIDAADWRDIAQKLEKLVEVMRDVLLNEEKQEDKNQKLRDIFGKFFPPDFSKIIRCGKVTVAVTGAVATTTQAAARPYASEDYPIGATNYRAITEDEQEWLIENQPLLFVESDNTIKGTFKLRADLCDKEKRLLNLHQFAPKSPDESYIEDSYRIHFGLDTADGLPKIWETEGKILEQLEPRGIDNEADAHIYPGSGMLCLGLPDELRRKIQEKSTLPFIVDELITPYFYYHSSLAKSGKELWTGLAHNKTAAVLQNYYEQHNSVPNLLDWLRQLSPAFLFGIIHNKKIGRNKKCLCSREVKAGECDCGAIAGYDLLRKKVTEYVQRNYSIPLPQAQNEFYYFCKRQFFEMQRLAEFHPIHRALLKLSP